MLLLFNYVFLYLIAVLRQMFHNGGQKYDGRKPDRDPRKSGCMQTAGEVCIASVLRYV